MHPRFQPWQVQVRDNAYPVAYRQGTWALPVEAVRFLEESGGCGNLLTPFINGEFAFWRLYPRFRVSLDGRLECVYPMDVFHRQVQAGWSGQMDTPALEQADWVLIQRDLLLCKTLLESPKWQTAYQDETYVVFRRARKPPSGGPRSAPAPAGRQGRNATGWSPVSAFFHPERDRERFRAYAAEAQADSPRSAACRAR
jgi:hypothetical protein